MHRRQRGALVMGCVHFCVLMKRNTTRRNKHRAIIAKGKPDCHWCSEPIDYHANWLHPLAFQVDHVIPLAKGGIDELHYPDGTVQKVASHRRCNRAKSDKLPLPAGAKFVTARAWS
jgi:5-methylcytosine-specific restriction endonuclease McrA